MNQPNYTLEQIALQIQKWLGDTIRTGKTYYLKSKEIGQTLGINPKSAGICLASLCEEENLPFTIVKWSLSPSITWQIKRKETWTENDMKAYFDSLEKEIDAAVYGRRDAPPKDSAKLMNQSELSGIDESKIIRV